ncbi:MAG: hypothetical protein SW019_19305 [Actinomycetota bacterium]|nr:hypothetical protein [Actinomycetota bacterium]
MNSATKSYLASGVALAGASVIAVAPVVTAPPDSPDMKIPPAAPMSTAEVQLAATVDPITAWVDVVTSAYSNAAVIGEEVLANPLPTLRQFVLNQIGNGETGVTAAGGAVEGFVNYISPDNPGGLVAQLQTAAEELTSGDVAGAIDTTAQALVLGPVLNIGLPVLTSGLLEIPGTIAQNVANVVETVTDPGTALPVVLGGLGAVLGPVNAVGDSLQEALDAAVAGDPITAATAIVNVPAVVTGALLNGYTNIAGTVYPGLLSTGGGLNGGLVEAFTVTLPNAIADAITPEESQETTGPAQTPAIEASAQAESGGSDAAAVDAVSQTSESTGPAEAAAGDAAEDSGAGAEQQVAEQGETVRVAGEGSADSADSAGSEKGSGSKTGAVSDEVEETTGTEDDLGSEELSGTEDGTGSEDEDGLSLDGETDDNAESGSIGDDDAADSDTGSGDSNSSDPDDSDPRESGSDDSDDSDDSDSDSGSDSGDSGSDSDSGDE